jgi:plastocyanin
MDGLRGLWLFPALALGACAYGGPAYGPPPRDAAAVVAMTTGLGFSPEHVTIRVGETVEWRNRSPFTHTVTADAAKVATPADVSLPIGAAPFASDPVPPGETYRHHFDVAGTYRYVCSPHEGLGMAGTVTVLP